LAAAVGAVPPAQGDIAEIGRQPNSAAFMADIRENRSVHDPEKCAAVFRKDHAQTTT
jgi:hypothetical protein